MSEADPLFTHCPKCAHAPLPRDQSLPVACPSCGVILAKIGARPQKARTPTLEVEDETGLRERWLHVPDDVDPWGWRMRATLWLMFVAWSVNLIGADVRYGELSQSFLHGPLLVFHEAGHVIFRAFGEWMTVFGGSLNQSLMPLIMAAALLLKNRDPFGAALGAWLFGVSLMDTAAYVYDALVPQLVLLGGHTGAEGPHDWMYLLDSVGLLPQAQRLGLALHAMGAAVMMASLVWAAWVLRLQWLRLKSS